VGQVLHGRATTTEAVRRAIQAGEESVRALARRHGISPTTVRKWRKRTFTTDAAMGPKAPRSTVLSPEDEAVVVAFRRHTLLPLDDCLYALQPSLPHLTRSSLHRCLRRHGIARLPETDGAKPGRSRFKAYPIGFFHIDIAEVHTEEGRLYLFVAVDRTSKFAFAQLHERATRRVAADFLHALVAAVPYRIHTVLTDNGTQFVDRTPVDEEAEAAAEAYWAARGEPRVWLVHAFDHACEQHGVEHRTTKPAHPWTTDEVEKPLSAVRCYFSPVHG
jgi:transposase InsO family protein